MSVEELQYLILTELSKSNAPIGASLLSLQIDVSQATIGRVLQWLEFKQYIEKSSNKGRVLTEKGKIYLSKLDEEFSSEKYVSQLTSLIASKDMDIYVQVLRLRLILERETAYQAALNISNEQAAELEAVLTHEMEQRELGWFGDDDNRNFHLMIAHISGNQAIEHLLKLIMVKTDSYTHLTFLQYRKIMMRNTRAHFDILNALKDKNPLASAEAMEAYIQSLIGDAETMIRDHTGVDIESPLPEEEQ